MDDLDEKLITLLRHNGRRSISDVAIDLGVSRATVRARMERLEQSGDIIGYTVILRSDAVDLPVRGIMMIEIEGHVADRVVKALGGFSEISAVHTTNGRFDLVVELECCNTDRFRCRAAPHSTGAGHQGQRNQSAACHPRSTRARL